MKDIVKRVFLLAVICGGVFFACGKAGAAELSPLGVARRLQETYDKTRTMTADFHQLTTVQMSRREREASGTVIIAKPGRIRWDYLKPDRQVLVSDAKTIRMYFAKSAQMIVRPVSEYLNSDVTYSFFAGTGNILKDFEILPGDDRYCRQENEEQQESSPASDYCIKLVPKEIHPQVDFLHVWVDRQTFLINRLQIVDQFGSITYLIFSHIKVNEKIPASAFEFTPPPGTEIITQ